MTRLLVRLWKPILLLGSIYINFSLHQVCYKFSLIFFLTVVLQKAIGGKKSTVESFWTISQRDEALTLSKQRTGTQLNQPT